MKYVLIFLCFISNLCFAQQGYISTFVGTGVFGFSGDGGPATAARMGEAMGSIATDAAGNIYFADINCSRIRKVTPAGIISTFAGGGSSKFDGVPATSCVLAVNALAADKSGNLIITDGNRVRKISISTGIIYAVAGTNIAGFSGDWGMATSAQLNTPMGLCTDAIGNIYIADEGNRRIRKVTTSGIITTLAGTGAAGCSGDGAPAIYAAVSPAGLCFDASGNMYVADKDNNRIRKITAGGIITTIAGNSTGGFGGDGSPAIFAILNSPSSVCMDSYGNLYISDFTNGRVRMIDPSKVITTVGGGGSSVADGIPATAEALSFPWGVGVDAYNNFYVTDRYNFKIRKINGVGMPSSSADSFMTWTNKACNGPEMTIQTVSYTAGMYAVTDFGDGHRDTSAILPGYTHGGFATLSHPFNNTATYSIEQVLYRSGRPIDTIRSSFTYTWCRTLPIRLYFDDNANGDKDNIEPFMSRPTITRVDSNGITVDSISATGGINYNAYGPPGTVYSFRVIAKPGNTMISAPATGILSDTMDVVSSYGEKYFGLTCPFKAAFDLSVNPIVVQTGVLDQAGHVYVANSACDPLAATVTLQFSPKWTFDAGRARPPASAVTATSATWSIAAVSPGDAAPVDIYYFLWSKGGAKLIPGDTVHSCYSVTPATGDLYPPNNTMARVDTVRAGCDPNAIEVLPSGCIPAGTRQLQYTIHFENTGNDTAHNIYVMDTLPHEVNAASLRLLSASANMNISVYKHYSGTIVKFDFPGINLPDSSHHGACDGAVTFTIGLNKDLPFGTSFTNRAGIFFDYNDVVLTNWANSTIGCPALSLQDAHDQNTRLWPNPAMGNLHIHSGRACQSITISESMGRKLMQQDMTGSDAIVDVSRLTAGMYFITLTGESGTEVQKFIKQ